MEKLVVGNRADISRAQITKPILSFELLSTGGHDKEIESLHACLKIKIRVLVGCSPFRLASVLSLRP